MAEDALRQRVHVSATAACFTSSAGRLTRSVVLILFLHVVVQGLLCGRHSPMYLVLERLEVILTEQAQQSILVAQLRGCCVVSVHTCLVDLGAVRCYGKARVVVETCAEDTGDLEPTLPFLRIFSVLGRVHHLLVRATILKCKLSSSEVDVVAGRRVRCRRVVLLAESLSASRILQWPQMILCVVIFGESSGWRRTIFVRLFSVQMVLQGLFERVQATLTLY